MSTIIYAYLVLTPYLKLIPRGAGKTFKLMTFTNLLLAKFATYLTVSLEIFIK